MRMTEECSVYRFLFYLQALARSVPHTETLAPDLGESQDSSPL